MQETYRDAGSSPGSGRSPGGGNRNPLQYSYLENPLDGGAWEATVHGVAHTRKGMAWRGSSAGLKAGRVGV